MLRARNFNRNQNINFTLGNWYHYFTTILFLLILLSFNPVESQAGGLLLYNNGCGNTAGAPNPCIRTLTCDIQGTNYPTTVYGYKGEVSRTMGAAGICDMVHVRWHAGARCQESGARYNAMIWAPNNTAAYSFAKNSDTEWYASPDAGLACGTFVSSLPTNLVRVVEPPYALDNQQNIPTEDVDFFNLDSSDFPFTIQGKAQTDEEYGNVVAGVEISFDGGATWTNVTTCIGCGSLEHVSWTYSWADPGAGDYSILTRATDSAAIPAGGNKEFVYRGDTQAWGPINGKDIPVRVHASAPADIVPPNFAGVISGLDAGTGGAVNLGWHPAHDQNGPIIYKVYINQGGAITATEWGATPYAVTTNSSGFTVTGLTDGLPYTFSVRAEDSLGNITNTLLDSGEVQISKGYGGISIIPTTSAAPVAGRVQFITERFYIDETAGTATVEVSRTGGSAGLVRVAYETTEGDALDNIDYTHTFGLLEWADGDTANKSFNVTILDDGLSEGSEFLNVRLFNRSGGIEFGEPNAAWVLIVDDEGGGSDSTPPEDITLSASNPTYQSVDLTWTAPGDDGASGTSLGYDIRYSTSGAITDANWASATEVDGEPYPLAGGTAESFTVFGIASNTQFWFAIKAFDEQFNWSSVISSPTSTTLTEARTMISSNAADADTDAQITVYAYFSGDTDYDSSTAFEWNTADSWPGTTTCGAETSTSIRSCPIGSLSPNTDYYFRVTHNDPDGVVGTNPEVLGPVPTLPAVPAAPTFSGATSNSVFVNWTAPSGGADTYKLESSNDDTNWVQVATGITGLSYKVVGLNPSSTKYFRVSGANASGTGLPSASSSTVTSACSSPVIINPNGISASGAWTNLTARVIQDSDDSTIAVSPAPSPNLMTASLYNSPCYTGATITSATVHVRARMGTNQEFLDWGPTGFMSGSPQLVNSTYSSLTDFNKVFGTNPATTSAWTSTELDALTIDIEKTSSQGTGTIDVAEVWVEIVYTGGDSTPPTGTTITGATDATTGGAVDVTWTAGSDTSLPITYNVYYSTTTPINFGSASKVAGLSGTGATISGLTNGTPYYFAVRAVDGVSNEDSNTVEQSATPSDTAPPTGTTISTAVDAGTDGAVDVTWSAGTDPSTPITYTVYYSTTTPINFGSASTSTGLSGTSTQITGLTNDTPYYFAVRATDSASNEDTNTTEQSATPTLLDVAAPTGTTVSTAVDAATDGEVDVTWSAGSDPSTPITYTVYYQTTTPINFGSASTSAGLSGTSTTISGLTNGQIYYFAVRAKDNVGNEDTNTSEQNATPTDTVAPTGTTVSTAVDATTDGAVNVTWSAGTDPSTPITYTVYYSTTTPINFGSASTSTGLSGTSTQITGLTNDTPYYFAVRATDSASNEDINTSEQSATPTLGADSTAPTGTTISTAVDAATDGEVNVTWSAGTDPSTPITYTVYYQTTTPINFGSASTSTGLSGTSTTITGLTNGQIYYFAVRAKDNVGNEDINTAEQNATPSDTVAPTGTTVSTAVDATTDGAVNVTWSAGTDSSTPITYTVYYSTTTPINFGSASTSSGLSGTSTQITGLINDTPYYFAVRATDSASNEDINTSEQSATPTLGADSTPPTGTTVSTAVDAATDGEVNVTWSTGSDPSTPITYTVYYQTTTPINFGSASTSAGLSGTSTTITGLTNGQIYYFAVRAKDSVSNEDINTAEQNATPTDTAAPTGTAVTGATDAVTDGAVNVTWSAGTDPSTPITYTVYYSTTTPINFGSASTSAGLSGTSTQITGLTNGTPYYFAVRATDSASNEDGNTDEQSATPTLAADVTAPTGTTISTATDAVTNGAVNVTWSAGIDPSTPITYTVYYSTTTPINFGSASTSAGLSGTSTQITGLTNGTPYYFAVRAKDSVGNEDINTAEQSATPTLAADSTAPTGTTVLAAVDAGTNGAVNVTWSAGTDPSTPITYTVYYSTTTPINFGSASTSAGLSGTSTQITGLTNGTPYYFAVRAKDSLGNEDTNTSEQSATPTIADSTPPTGTVFIDGGATYTNVLGVTLTLTCSDGSGISGPACATGAEMNIDGAGWIPYSTSGGSTLVAGDGVKAVSVLLRDGLGNTSGAITDTILLDQTSPSGSISPSNGATDVPIVQNIVLTFTNGPIDCSTVVANSTVTISGAGCEASNLIFGACSGTEATFNHPLWTISSSCTVDVTTGINDLAGNPIGASSSSFTLSATGDTTPPAVLAGFSASDRGEGTTSNINWTNPSDSDAGGVLVTAIEGTCGGAPTGGDVPVSGISYTAGVTFGTATVAGNLIQVGADAVGSDIGTNLTEGVKYCLWGYAKDEDSNYALTPLNAQVIPYNRQLDHLDFNMISVPGAIIGGDTPANLFNDDLNRYIRIRGWNNGYVAVPGDVSQGAGYLLLNSKSDITAKIDRDYTFSNDCGTYGGCGYSQLASYEVPVSGTGWKLVGNPCMVAVTGLGANGQAIDINAGGYQPFATAVDNSLVKNSIYRWTGLNYSNVQNLADNTGFIQPWRAFWLYVKDPSVTGIRFSCGSGQ